MCSAPHAPHTAPETAARIRDAAIAEFAEHGFTRTTLRRIASTAGVSPGLVIHHFGSKAGLRTACDDHVFEALTAAKLENAGRPPATVAHMLGDGPMRTNAEYLLRSLLDPSEQGQRFFDHYVETIEAIIEDGFGGYTFRRSEDPRAQATAIAMLALAPLAFEPRARRALGTDDLTASMQRLTPYLTDLYRHGIVESSPEDEDAADPHTPDPHAAPDSQHDPPTEAAS